ncbi:MAG: MAPEG family protein [Pseudomonadales bacterium]|nr:MAPEG family protein [Pseudomonadales bacterium]
MTDAHPILLPVLVLVIWSIIQMLWGLSARLPAIGAAKLGPTAGQRTSELAEKLPREVQWKFDNYNHLMEQPTLFYATVIALAVAGLDTGLNLYLAWLYTGLRVVHSIVQSTSNPVMLRFSIFSLGSVALAAMAVNGVMQML